MTRPPAFVSIRLALVLTAIAIAVPLSAGEPHASLPSPGCTDGLGVNIHFTDPRPGEMEMLAAGGFRWVRMDLIWSATERARGRYDFSAYDRLLAALEAHQVRALFILDYSNALYEADRSVATLQGREAYARWAAAAASHFQGHGVLWEIWNEPNIRNFWQPEPNIEHYTAMALAAARAIREATPGEAIVGPATSTIDMKFLEGCFQAGLLEWWDAVSVHPYRQSAPETVATEYHRLRRLIAQYSPNDKPIPILSAEWGYSAAWKGFDAQKQGKMLSRQWLINLANRIPLSIWYDWHDDGRDPHEPEHHFGTVRHEYHEGRSPVYDPKPAYLAAKTLTSTLDGYQFAKRIATGHPDDYGLLFNKGDELRLAVWTTAAEPRQVRFPSADCRFDVISHTGDRRDPVSAEGGTLTLTISDAPQYLIATQPNRALADAPVAHDLRATLIPGPGRVVTIQVDNLAELPFQGKVRLVGMSGIEATEDEQSLRLAAGETNRSVRFPLAAKPDEQCRVGLRIEDETGESIFALPPRRFVFLPDGVLKSCRIVADGDGKVASEQSIAPESAPERLDSDLDEQVLRIFYRFGEGWKFLRAVPQSRELPEIEGTPTGFGLWVYGDGGHTSPRLRVRDATGQTWQPSGPEIDWKGWRYIELPLNASSGHWGGAEDSLLHPPLMWDSIFLLDNPTRKPAHGTVYIAAPVVLY